MAAVSATNAKEVVEGLYRSRTAKSRELYNSAVAVMPGGDTRSASHFPPYPTFMKSAHGSHMRDVDDNEYVDFLNNYSSLVHGHAHPAIVAAISDQVTRGTAFASPIESQIKLAQLLVGRIASLERVRFCNSGTEATLMAIRAAKAFTGRNKILKLQGGYHGTHDAAVVSGAADGYAGDPLPGTQDLGLFRGIAADVLSIPANEVAPATEMFETCGRDLAGVIIEPVMGGAGVIPLEPDFVGFLLSAAKNCGALMIFDEVITLRLSYGGAQEIYSAKPDLTTLGKLIGGGLPVGAFGGRADVMELFNPGNPRLGHSGTFNGNAATMAAGIAALELLTRDAIAHLNRLGDRLRAGLRTLLARAGIDAQVTGAGSLVGIHFAREAVRNYRAALNSEKRILPMLHLALMNRGIFIAPRGFVCISSVMTEAEVDQFIAAFEDAIADLQHAIRKFSSETHDNILH